MVSVGYAISQDRMMKGSSDVMDRSPSWQVTKLPNLVAIGIVDLEISYACLKPSLLFIIRNATSVQKEKKKGNCKALCVIAQMQKSRKEKAIAKFLRYTQT